MTSSKRQTCAPAPVLEASRMAELERRIVELTAAVCARDSFIAVAAHELRNPMTPIIGHIELLMSAVRAGRSSLAQVEQGLERIQQSVRRYVKRADILLEVSRIASGKAPDRVTVLRPQRAAARGGRRLRWSSPTCERSDHVGCP